MPKPISPAARARERLKHRQQQAADAPIAMAEYRAAEQALLERTRELRKLRLAREAELAAKRPQSSGEGPARR